MQIAFATDNNIEINQHFGQSPKFAIYEIDATDRRFVEIVDMAEIGDESDDKIQERIVNLRGCVVLYTTQIGGVAAARLVKNKIHPIKVENGHPINDILVKLQQRLAENPPIWLRRILTQESKARV